MRFCFFFLMIRRPPRSTLFPLHDALPILVYSFIDYCEISVFATVINCNRRLKSYLIFIIEESVWDTGHKVVCPLSRITRSEEHTSELQSRQYLVCRLLLEKKIMTLHILHY